MKAPIRSVKHYVQWTLQTVAPAGTKVNETIALAVTPTASNTNVEVPEGSLIKAVYIELWITSDDTSGSSFSINFEKDPGGASNMTYAESIVLHDYKNKKNIFYETMGLMGPNDEFPLVVFKGWIKIPKGKQRMGLGDVLDLNISAITNGMNYCGFATSKEYS